MFKISYLQLFITSILLFGCKQEFNLSREVAVDKTINVLPSTGGLEAPAETNGFTLHGIVFPDELILQIFNYLSVKDIAQASRVCQGWNRLSEDPILWRTVRLRIHGDYPANDATKEQAKLHTLRVHVNTLTDLAIIKQLITKYNLNNGRSFVRYQNLAYKLVDKLSPEVIEEQVAQGSEIGIERKIEGLAYDDYGYDEYYEYDDDEPLEAVAYNEQLVEKGNEKAIARKVNGISYGHYGYEKNVQLGFELNESLVKEGCEVAIARKVKGFASSNYGYIKDLQAAAVLNEYFVEQGNRKAINRKVRGLSYSLYGYEKDLKAAHDLNEYSIMQGNSKAINRKVKGLAYGSYGYDKDPLDAVAYNEQLIEEGNESAIIRKLKRLTKEGSIYSSKLPLYPKDLPQLKKWLEEEATKGTRWACYLVSKGLKYGILGFEKDQEAAIEYIKRYNIPY